MPAGGISTICLEAGWASSEDSPAFAGAWSSCGRYGLTVAVGLGGGRVGNSRSGSVGVGTGVAVSVGVGGSVGVGVGFGVGESVGLGVNVGAGVGVTVGSGVGGAGTTVIGVCEGCGVGVAGGAAGANGAQATRSRVSNPAASRRGDRMVA